jgi:hypothetical protein
LYFFLLLLLFFSVFSAFVPISGLMLRHRTGNPTGYALFFFFLTLKPRVE